MTNIVTGVRDVLEGVVFGNGWLALGGLAVTIGIVVLVRITRGITV